MSLDRKPWRPGAASTLRPTRWRWKPDPEDALSLARLKHKVATRAEWRCEGCGKALATFSDFDLAHRVSRRVKWWRYHLSNLLALCRSCHEVAGAGNPDAERYGFWLRTTADPTSKSVTLYVFGKGWSRTVRLTEAGTYEEVA